MGFFSAEHPNLPKPHNPISGAISHLESRNLGATLRGPSQDPSSQSQDPRAGALFLHPFSPKILLQPCSLALMSQNRAPSLPATNWAAAGGACPSPFFPGLTLSKNDHKPLIKVVPMIRDGSKGRAEQVDPWPLGSRSSLAPKACGLNSSPCAQLSR